MKNIRKIVKYILFCFVILLVSIYCFFELDMKVACLDSGEIYDPIQKKCRNDCLTWDDNIGCVPITEENRKKKENGEPFS